MRYFGALPLSGPSGPECRKSLENVSRRLRRNPGKFPKSLGNSPERLFRHFPETFRRLPRLFPRLSGEFSGFGGQIPRETFRDFFGISGLKGPARETSVRGGLVRNPGGEVTAAVFLCLAGVRVTAAPYLGMMPSSQVLHSLQGPFLVGNCAEKPIYWVPI